MGSNPRDIELRLASGRLHALRTGPEDGAPVICVPGLSSNCRSFDLVAAALAERGHDVVALDLRGRGRSAATNAGTHGWRLHAQDVLDAAASLGFGPFDLIGHSMGAFVSMQAAALAAERIRRLVLIDGAGVPEPAALPPILAAVQRLGAVYPSRDAFCDVVQNAGAAQPWEELWKTHYLDELEDVPSGVQARTSKDAVLEDIVYGSSQDATAFWSRLTMPTLLVRAGRPLLPGAGFIVGAALRDAFLEAVSSAEAVEIDANHYGVMAHPDALRAIAGFLTC
jgi:pimeloyl-ACP methyl ester carboxylesterase